MWWFDMLWAYTTMLLECLLVSFDLIWFDSSCIVLHIALIWFIGFIPFFKFHVCSVSTGKNSLDGGRDQIEGWCEELGGGNLLGDGGAMMVPTPAMSWHDWKLKIVSKSPVLKGTPFSASGLILQKLPSQLYPQIFGTPISSLLTFNLQSEVVLLVGGEWLAVTHTYEVDGLDFECWLGKGTRLIWTGWPKVLLQHAGGIHISCNYIFTWQ